MDMFYIPAIASFSGSASGTLASIVTTWVTQRRKDRFRHSLRATSQREELYKNFIEEAGQEREVLLIADLVTLDLAARRIPELPDTIEPGPAAAAAAYHPGNLCRRQRLQRGGILIGRENFLQRRGG